MSGRPDEVDQNPSADDLERESLFSEVLAVIPQPTAKQFLTEPEASRTQRFDGDNSAS